MPGHKHASYRTLIAGERRDNINLPVPASPMVTSRGYRAFAGAVHEPTVAWIWGIVQELAASDLGVLGDKGLPRRGPYPHPLSGMGKPASKKEASRAHAWLRSPSELGNAQLS